MKAFATTILMVCVALGATAQERKCENLQVLPADISNRDLGDLMLGGADGSAASARGVVGSVRGRWGRRRGQAPEVASAKQEWIALMLERSTDSNGVGSALDQLARVESSLAAAELTPGALDSLAWRLNRSNREVAGHALIKANYAKFPSEYRAIESWVFILSDTDREEEGD